MGGKTSSTTSQVQIPPDVLARYNSVNQTAEQVAQTPFQQYSTNPNAFVAPITPTQTAGIENTNAAAGMAQPYFNAATGFTLAGSGAVNPSALDASAIQQYYNPYVSSVLGSTSALINQNNQQAQAGQLGNAITSGAYGGDRAGIAAAILAGQQQLAAGQTYSGILSDAYTNAQQVAQQQQGVGLAAGQANRQAIQQTGQTLGGLGTAAQGAALTGAQAQLGAGQVEQQTEQAGLTALYNQFLQQQSYPFQTAQFLANIAEGTGALSGSTTTSTQPGGLFSDERLKEDIIPVGKTFDGQNIIRFRYKGDPTVHVGFSAQETARIHPEAVSVHPSGFLVVDYGRATANAAGFALAANDDWDEEPEPRRMRAAGGRLARQAGGEMSGWGLYPQGVNPMTIAQLLQAQAQMYGPGFGGAGLYGGSASGTPHGGQGYVPAPMQQQPTLMVARPPVQPSQSPMQQAASIAGNIDTLATDAGKAGNWFADQKWSPTYKTSEHMDDPSIVAPTAHDNAKLDAAYESAQQPVNLPDNSSAGFGSEGGAYGGYFRADGGRTGYADGGWQAALAAQRARVKQQEITNRALTLSHEQPDPHLGRAMAPTADPAFFGSSGTGFSRMPGTGVPDPLHPAPKYSPLPAHYLPPTAPAQPTNLPAHIDPGSAIARHVQTAQQHISAAQQIAAGAQGRESPDLVLNTGREQPLANDQPINADAMNLQEQGGFSPANLQAYHPNLFQRFGQWAGDELGAAGRWLTEPSQSRAIGQDVAAAQQREAPLQTAAGPVENQPLLTTAPIQSEAFQPSAEQLAAGASGRESPDLVLNTGREQPLHETPDLSDFAARGGFFRAARADGGDTDPYDSGNNPYGAKQGPGLNIPTQGPSQAPKLATAAAPSGGQSGLGQLAGLAGDASSIIGAGNAIGSIPGVAGLASSLGGGLASAAGAIGSGIAGAAGGIGSGLMSLLPLLALERGGRAGFDDGGATGPTELNIPDDAPREQLAVAQPPKQGSGGDQTMNDIMDMAKIAAMFAGARYGGRIGKQDGGAFSSDDPGGIAAAGQWLEDLPQHIANRAGDLWQGVTHPASGPPDAPTRSAITAGLAGGDSPIPAAGLAAGVHPVMGPGDLPTPAPSSGPAPKPGAVDRMMGPEVTSLKNWGVRPQPGQAPPARHHPPPAGGAAAPAPAPAQNAPLTGDVVQHTPDPTPAQVSQWSPEMALAQEMHGSQAVTPQIIAKAAGVREQPTVQASTPMPASVAQQAAAAAAPAVDAQGNPLTPQAVQHEAGPGFPPATQGGLGSAGQQGQGGPGGFLGGIEHLLGGFGKAAMGLMGYEGGGQWNKDQLIPFISALAGTLAAPTKYPMVALTQGLNAGAQSYMQQQQREAALTGTQLQNIQYAQSLLPPGMRDTFRAVPGADPTGRNTVTAGGQQYHYEPVWGLWGSMGGQRPAAPGVQGNAPGAQGGVGSPQGPAGAPISQQATAAVQAGQPGGLGDGFRPNYQAGAGGTLDIGHGDRGTAYMQNTFADHSGMGIPALSTANPQQMNRQILISTEGAAYQDRENQARRDNDALAGDPETTGYMRRAVGELAGAFADVPESGLLAGGLGADATTNAALFANRVLKAFGFGANPGITQAGDAKQIIDKLRAYLGDAAAKMGNGNPAASEIQNLANVLPGLETNKGAGMKVLAQMMVRNEKQLDFQKYRTDHEQTWGTEQGARAAWVADSADRYDREEQMLPKLMMRKDGQPSIMEQYLKHPEWRQQLEQGGTGPDGKPIAGLGAGMLRYFGGAY